MGHRQEVNYIVAINLATGERRVDATLATFLDWACNGDRPSNKARILWAHNGAKYDTRLVYDYCVNNMPASSFEKGSTFADSKIFELRLVNAHFRDSYLHIQMPLAQMPKAFGIDTAGIAESLGVAELKKGFFPYRFNTPENQAYVGPLPALEYYEPDKRKKRDPYAPSEGDRDGVVAWHAAETERVRAAGNRWCLQDELKEYCIMDTLILAEALREWQRLNLSRGNSDPLTSLTLPGHAHKTFRAKHLQPDTIPILRAFSDYRSQRNLDEEFIARQAYYGGNTNVRRVLLELTDEEVASGHRIAMFDFRSQYPSVMVNHPYPVGDYQFYDYQPDEPLTQPTRDFILSHHGVIACEIAYPATLPPLFHPVLPMRREGKLCFSLEDDTMDAEEIQRHLVANCPDGPHCRRCKRIRGVQPSYTLLEVHKALEVGYVISYVYWILGTTQVSTTLFNSYVGSNYGLKTQNSGVPDGVDFDDPAAVEEFVRRHAEIGVEIAVEEGADVRTWFAKNSGLKQLGKLMMNSQYGKLGQVGYRTELQLLDTQTEEELMWLGDGQDYSIVGRNYFQEVAEYRIKRKSVGNSIGTTNVLIAAYVTAHGRLLLWELCHQFGKDVLYHDTDSALIHLRPGIEPPSCGPYLGELEEEVRAAHAFVSTGPKSYAIKYWVQAAPAHYEFLGRTPAELAAMEPEERDTLLTVLGEGGFRWGPAGMEYEKIKQRNKGITLSSENAKVLNYESMKLMVKAMCGVEDEELDSLQVNSTNFIWKRDVNKFFVTEGVKQVRAKRSILKGELGGPEGYHLMPFGWDRWTEEQWGF